MSNLKVRLQLIVEDEGSSFSRVNLTSYRVIDRDIAKQTGLDFPKILDREVKNALDSIRRGLSENALPWELTLREIEEILKTKFEEKFPAFYPNFIVTSTGPELYSYAKKGVSLQGEEFELSDGYATTVYRAIFKKYPIGWSYQYQGSEAYEGEIQYIEPPIPEADLKEFLASLPYPVTIVTWPTHKLPERKEYE